MNFSSRKRKAASAFVQIGLDGLLVTHLPDVRYLTGFTGSNAALAMAGGRAVLVTDGRYTAQAKNEASGTRVIIAKKSAVAVACEWLVERGVKRCGFDAAHTTVAALDAMRKAVPAQVRRKMFVASEPLVARLREVKDADEIAKIRQAALAGCGLFDGMLEHLRPGLKEIEVAAELEHRARLAGAEGMSFETIIASGERSALPHGRASEARLPKRGFVTMDCGVVLDGYMSDMPRTVHLGPAQNGE